MTEYLNGWFAVGTNSVNYFTANSDMKSSNAMLQLVKKLASVNYSSVIFLNSLQTSNFSGRIQSTRIFQTSQQNW